MEHHLPHLTLLHVSSLCETLNPRFVPRQAQLCASDDLWEFLNPDSELYLQVASSDGSGVMKQLEAGAVRAKKLAEEGESRE